ncbi:hypothetical protein F2P56_032787, partial [Juglans regia]
MATSTDSFSSSAAFHLPTQVISIKLDGTNFLAWSAQLLPLFRSYGLMGIVDGSEPSPPQFASAEHKTQGISNPAYVVWKYKDQTVLCWIVSSLSPVVVSTIYGLETSQLAWQALGASFVAPSTSRISLIKRKLQSLQQGFMPCQNFLDEVKSLADELSAIGKPIDDSDLILSVLNGLNSSFHSFVTTYMLLAKEKSMSFSDFHAELLNYDLMQKFHSQTIQPEAGSYALYSHKPGSKSGSRTNTNKSHFSRTSKGSGPAPSQFRQPLPHMPSSAPPATSASRSRSPCQICKRGGHQALDCFNRMNYSFQGRHPPTDLVATVAEANTTYLNQHQWYADSGANVHVTSDLANLATSQPYEGDDFVGVGNGTGLTISRTGTASIQTLSSTLTLSNVAYCPHASAHLLSINKFCKDNNVLFELIGSNFSVKDILTGDTLLTGPSANGLYPINLRQLSSSKFHALTMTIGVKASTSTWCVYISRNVIFDEGIFPAHEQSIFPGSDNCLDSSALTTGQPESSLDSPSSIIPLTTFSPASHAIAPSTTSSAHSPPAFHEVASSDSLDRPLPLPISSSHMLIRSQTGHSKPRSFPDFHLHYSTRYPLQALHAGMVLSKPRNYTHAASIPEWHATMDSEFQALLKNETWSLCPRPLGKNVVPCKWVFKLKRKPDGSIDRHKARLVAVGYLQRSGIDFHDTFSPVIKPSTVRMVLAIAVSFNWDIWQLDVSNAFLHGILEEEVYMTQPKGFEDPVHPQFVCKLHKSLYGLKQAPRAWFNRLSTALLSLGFHSSQVDPSLFTYHQDSVHVFLLVYVDDILVTSNDRHFITSLISNLQLEFAMKDLGQLTYFLGIEATRNSSGLHLRQT